MKQYIAKRLWMFVLVLLGVSILSFALVELFGNDPAEIIARRGSIYATHEMIEETRHAMGMDRPLPVRYLAWLKGLFTGDVGISIYSFKPIMQDIGKYMPVSLELVAWSLAWVILLSVPLSLLSARFSGSAIDHVVRVLSIVGLCFPAFWLGFLLLLFFAVRLSWFTVMPAPGVKGFILPSFALALPVASAFIRVFRASLLKESNSDYALYAQARGLSKSRVLLRHGLRNALPPVITMLCQYLGYLIAGSAVIESVFSLKGIGTYMVGCVTASDATAVATCVVLIAGIFVIANLAGDLINRLLCPWMVRESNV